MFNNDPLADKILEYVKTLLVVFEHKLEKKNLSEISEDQLDVFLKQTREIRYELMKNPGLIIYITDEKDRELYEQVINFVWGHYDTEIKKFENIYLTIKDNSESMSEIFGIDDEVLIDLNEIFYDINTTYLYRALKLRPTFVSMEPNYYEFECLFQEAMKSWLFGLNTAAINLCWAIIENLFREKLIEIKKISKLYYLNKNFLRELIDKVNSEGIIDNKNKDIAHHIRQLRNMTTHDLKIISDDETYKIIQQTKEIAISILKSN